MVIAANAPPEEAEKDAEEGDQEEPEEDAEGGAREEPADDKEGAREEPAEADVKEAAAQQQQQEEVKVSRPGVSIPMTPPIPTVCLLPGCSPTSYT